MDSRTYISESCLFSEDDEDFRVELDCLILSINVKASYNEIVFNIFKGCKKKDYLDANAVTTWEKVKRKYEPISARSMFKLGKQFRHSSPKKF
jgi:hypothetical protein